MKKRLYLRRVVGQSMQPTLKPDQIVVAASWLKVRSQDLVIAKVNGLEIVKRVENVRANQIALASDNQNHGFYGVIESSLVVGRIIGVL